MFKNVWKLRQSKLMEERIDNVSEPVYGFGVDTTDSSQVALMDCVLSELRSYLYEKELVLKPDDNLEWLIGIDQTEITDIFETVVLKMNCRLPESTCILPPIQTVGDFVREAKAYCFSNA